jgi:hypothetical protein
VETKKGAAECMTKMVAGGEDDSNPYNMEGVVEGLLEASVVRTAPIDTVCGQSPKK